MDDQNDPRYLEIVLDDPRYLEIVLGQKEMK